MQYINNSRDKQVINSITPPEVKPTPLANTQLKIASFNLCNYLEPPNAFYEFERIYSAEQWQKKQRWIVDYLSEYQPDIIGFQEVFSTNSLQELMLSQGYQYFKVIDQPEIIDDFIYKRPVVAIASRYPIVDTQSITPNTDLAQSIGLSESFSFSRKVLRATIDVPHIGNTDCYVVHFKSKRSMLEPDENNQQWSGEKAIIESFKAQVAGSWGSTLQRGSEAALLMLEIIERREQTGQPIILMGDFNNTLTDGVLSHLLIHNLRFVSSIDRDTYLAKYCLNDAWTLFQTALTNDAIENEVIDTVNKAEESHQSTLNIRTPTHYFGGKGSVLDYILLSCEFDASYHDSFYQISAYHVYDRHLINPVFDRDGESTDHGVVLATLELRS
ncbi:MAG: endonuclease/exonuclease/phosphatase family protein [Thalassotalea sp.]